MREPEIVLPLHHVVGELVAESKAEPIRCTVRGNYIEPGNLGFLSAVLRKIGHHQRLSTAAQNRSIAFVEPLRLYARLAIIPFAAFQPHAEHLHAIGERLHFAAYLFVHGIPRISAAQMGQAGPGNDAMSRVRMIERRQQAAIGKEFVVIVLWAVEPFFHKLREAAAALRWPRQPAYTSIPRRSPVALYRSLQDGRHGGCLDGL